MNAETSNCSKSTIMWHIDASTSWKHRLVSGDVNSQMFTLLNAMTKNQVWYIHNTWNWEGANSPKEFWSLLVPSDKIIIFQNGLHPFSHLPFQFTNHNYSKIHDHLCKPHKRTLCKSRNKLQAVMYVMQEV